MTGGISRRAFLKSTALAAASLALPPLSKADARSRNRPDVLFIAIDDLNDWTTLFDKGNPIKTPNLERLAARGTLFTRAYCAAPACNPSRAAVLTGYRPTTTGCYDNGGPGSAWWKTHPDAVTLPQYFRNHGYVAKGAGKIFHHGGPARGDDPRGTEHSWDEFQKLVPTRVSKHHNGYTKDEDRHLASIAFDWGEHDRKMVDEDMLEKVSSFLQERPKEPMFIAAGIFKPHLPFYAPPEVFRKYPMDGLKLPLMPENDLADVPEAAKRMAHREFFIFSNVMKKPDSDPGSHKKMVQCYQASADYADSVVGRLLDRLDASGRADHTVIVLWADHGYHLGDKESCVKFTLWEKATHVPLIIVAPGVTKPGTRCHAPVSLVDIYPTLLELAGLPPKPDNDGRSLVPLLKNPRAPWPFPAVMTMGRGNHAVRSPRWRYIRYRDGSEELYDHKYDPWEWSNLAGEPRYADVKARLARWLPKETAPSAGRAKPSAAAKKPT